MALEYSSLLFQVNDSLTGHHTFTACTSPKRPVTLRAYTFPDGLRARFPNTRTHCTSQVHHGHCAA